MLSGILFVGDYPLIEKYTINLPKPWERSASGPSFIEDPMKPLQSPRFKELWEIFRDMGMDVADAFEQFGFVNAVPNRWQGTDLSNKTASMFAPRLNQIIMQYRPKVIIPVGIMATWAVLGPRLSGRISNTKADDFFGKTIPDRYYNAWVCPTWGCPFMAGFRRKAEEDNAYRKDCRKGVNGLQRLRIFAPEVDAGITAIVYLSPELTKIRTALVPQPCLREQTTAVTVLIDAEAEVYVLTIKRHFGKALCRESA